MITDSVGIEKDECPVMGVTINPLIAEVFGHGQLAIRQADVEYGPDETETPFEMIVLLTERQARELKVFLNEKYKDAA